MIIKGREKESISFIDKFNAVGNFTYSIFCHAKKSTGVKISVVIFIILVIIKAVI